MPIFSLGGGISMCLKPEDSQWIPEETTKVAKSIYPKGNRVMLLRDSMGSIYQDSAFEDCYPKRGQPGEAPWRLALVTVLQFMENLSDREAAEAVRSRIDWKYALGLELSDTGFHHTVLCKFRKRLVEYQAEARLLDHLLEACREHGFLKARSTTRTDATHVLAQVRALNRLGNIVEAMRVVLEDLSILCPDWLKEWVSPDWKSRYGYRWDSFRLSAEKEAQRALLLEVGRDAHALFGQLKPAYFQLPSVEFLRQMLLQQYVVQDGVLQCRISPNFPPTSQLLASPYDPDARLGSKRKLQWTGYKVHVSETCENKDPHLVTHVVTAQPNRRDNMELTGIHQSLEQKDLLPANHLVDAGYVDAQLLVESKEQYDIQLIGPALSNNTWQAKEAEAFRIQDFTINWEQQQVTCPNGKVSRYWKQVLDHAGNDMIRIGFSSKDCTSCPLRSRCTKAQKGARYLGIRPQAQFEALTQQRQALDTTWKTLYKKRSGVEGTLSQGVRAFGLRRSRYIGQVKTHLQHLAIGAAYNLSRLGDWLQKKPRSQTRQSRFLRLVS
jgi:transposase